jgi:cytoskeletal protein RodZ
MENNEQNPTPSPETIAASVPPQPETPEINFNFGDWLTLQRTQRKISLEEIAAVTKVHIQQLKSLEKNDVSKLPAAAFVRGFLVSYARHLGIDENEVLDHYKSAFGGSLTPIADLLTPTNRSARSASAPKVAMVSSPQMREAPSTRNVETENRPAFSMKFFGIVIGVIATLGLIGTLIAIGKKSKTTNNETAVIESPASPIAGEPASSVPATPVPEVKATAAVPAPPAQVTPPVSPVNSEISKAPVPAPVTTATATPPTTPATDVTKTVPAAAANSAPEAAKKFQLEFKAIEGNYVHLRIDDASPKGITLKAGQTHLAGVDRKAVLTISDAGNVEIRWNGTWYSAPGFRGDLKVITLPDQLSQLTAKMATPRARPKVAAPLSNAGESSPAAVPPPPPATGPED